ncbi:MAG: TonB-dependent receptor [Bdellovibrionota bacterium]
MNTPSAPPSGKAGASETRVALRRSVTRSARAALLCATTVLLSPAEEARAVPAQGGLETIADASLEELLNMRVTTVSKLPEEVRRAPAAVYVLTSEDIRRSGATSIPEVLRLVPGVNVAHVDANKWAVSIRGFNGRTANKLLVMIDGRSLYDPLFSGTLWETKNLMLEDIERVEVVRGPGGSTWGANAVNGVINIITKHSRETQGALVSAGGGTEERGFGDARYGGKLSESAFYRVYGRYAAKDEGYLPDGVSDDSYRGQGGFRFDKAVTDSSSYWLQGNIYDGSHDGAVPFNDVEGQGHSLQGQYDIDYGSAGHLALNGYYDHTDFSTPLLGEKRNTGEVNLQYTISPLDRFTVLSGLQYRLTADNIRNSSVLAVDPTERTDSLGSAMLQGRYNLIDDVLEMRTGLKLEYNDYSRYEFEPDAGLSWSINPDNTVWVSVSRAVRTPSRLENDFLIVVPDTGQTFVANRALNSENLLAYEAGYRAVPVEKLLLDFTVFYNEYEQLAIAEGNTLSNAAHGHTYGAELAATWLAASGWQLTFGYSSLKLDLSLDPESTADPSQVTALEGNSPENQVFLTSRLDFAQSWELDTTLRYVAHLSFPRVSSYVVADARIGYRVADNLRLDLIGQNLFRGHHYEQGDANASEIQQGVYGRVTWTF